MNLEKESPVLYIIFLPQHYYNSSANPKSRMHWEDKMYNNGNVIEKKDF